jgi:polyhydroxyalkanoate synthesis regulator phasin
LIYAIEGLGQEFKEKISDEDKELISKLVADGKVVKDKEDATVEEVKNETDRLQKESEPLFKKYAQTAQAPGGEGGFNPEDLVKAAKKP